MMLQIYCKNADQTKSFPEGSSLLDIYKGFDLQMPYGPVSAKVNNKVESLLIELHCITANAFYEFNDAEEYQHTSDNRREESSTRTLLRRPETISSESQDNPDYAKDRGEDV